MELLKSIKNSSFIIERFDINSILALRDAGTKAKLAFSLLIMTIVGGVVAPVIKGILWILLGVRRLPFSYRWYMLWGDWNVCTFESPRSSLDKRRIFRKPTFNSLYDPFGSPNGGQKPSLPLRKAPPFSPSLSSLRDKRM